MPADFVVFDTEKLSVEHLFDSPEYDEYCILWECQT